VIPDQHLAEFVLSGAERHPDRAALIDAASGRTLSYAELRAQVQGLAGALSRRGLRKGDAVGVLLPNCVEYPAVFFGVALAGGVCTTMNPVYTAHEIETQLRDSRARYLFAAPDQSEKAKTAADSLDIEILPLAELLEAPATPPDAGIDPARDLAALPYSSGTTGLPKGVMLTHRNLIANAIQSDQFIAEGDVAIAVSPLFHIMGMSVLMIAGLHFGATLVTMSRFDLEKFLQAIERWRVTNVVVAPPVTVALAKHPLVDSYDLSSLRIVITGGAPLGREVQLACGDRLRCQTAQGWGMTELAGAGSVSPTHGQFPDRPGTAGLCVGGSEIKVIDVASGDELGAGQDGELWFRGPNVMQGYLRRPAETAAALAPDGWLRTGDIGHLDGDGFVQIVDRLKELIKYKGYQVAPAELEALLLSHASVADAAVIPSPDPEAGEVPKALLVLKDAAEPEAILAFANERLAPYKRIRRYELIDAIPRTPSGKIVRRGLIERERTRAPR
jgi:acyl-CoA synthetase (AMP-forming)/AMP-acid ligase II